MSLFTLLFFLVVENETALPQVLGEPFSIYRFQSPPALGDSGGENLNPWPCQVYYPTDNIDAEIQPQTHLRLQWYQQQECQKQEHNPDNFPIDNEGRRFTCPSSIAQTRISILFWDIAWIVFILAEWAQSITQGIQSE